MKRRCVTEKNLVKTQRGLRTILTAAVLLAACLPAFAQQPTGLEPIPAQSIVTPAPNAAPNAAPSYGNGGWQPSTLPSGQQWQQSSTPGATPSATSGYPQATGQPSAADGCSSGGCPTAADQGLGSYMDCCEGEDCCPPAWTLKQGVKIMHRGVPRGIQLMNRDLYELRVTTWPGELPSTSVSGMPEPIFNSKSMKFDVAAGYYMTLSHYLGRDTRNRDHFLEFSYHGMNDWVERREIRPDIRVDAYDTAVSKTVNDTEIIGTRSTYRGFAELSSYSGHQYTTNALGQVTGEAPSWGFAEKYTGFNRIDELFVSYESRWDNFELNVRIIPRQRSKDRLVLLPNGRWRRECQVGWRPEYIVGLRGFSFDEWYYYAGRNWTTGTKGDYRIRTHNDAFGFQIGADLNYRYRKMSWGFRSRVAPVLNFAEQISDLSASGAENDSELVLDPNIEYTYDDQGAITGYTQGEPYWTRQAYPAENISPRSWSATKDKAACVLELGVGVEYLIYPNMKLHAGYDMMWVFGLATAPEQLSWNPDTAPWISAGSKIFFQSLNLGVDLVW